MSNLRGLAASFFPIKTFSRDARLFLIATIIDGIIYSAWSLFFNIFILARGFDKQFLGLVNSVPSIAALALGIPIGLLSDRIGRRKAMLLGLFVNTLALALQVIVVHPTLIIVMAFAGGLGSTLYGISQAPFMMKASTPQNRALLFSLNYGLMTLAGALGSLFAGQLPDLFSQFLHVGANTAPAYEAVLLASMLFGSLSLIPIFLIHEPADLRVPHGPGKSQHPRTLRQTFFRPLVIKLVLPNALIGFGAAILIPYMNVYFVERFHTSDQELGVLFGLSSLLIGLGCFIGPRLSANLGSKMLTVVVTQGASLFFLLVTGFSPLAWLAATGFLARGVLMNMAQPLFNAFAMEQIDASEQGAVNSLLTLSWQMGFSIGPYLSGTIQERFGFNPLFITTGIFYALAIAIAWIFLYRIEARTRPELAAAVVEVESTL